MISAMVEQGRGRLKRKARLEANRALAGETRFEHATYGFGDRYSTIEPLP